ncbi:hypothetical protein [Qipengyuania aquimaris]|uniref:hypothetical protein n=1 Tax=Qipengyuania aquimaris TaxID=255984 RepID=UPI001CD23A7A|nr:hypothetical protein [Qipengyuania aquimaris]MCA0904313.1 hypothetical protein [Qipengyuania aquimaris]
MMRLAAACLVFTCATPAHADWQGFKWGMKEKQVESAGSDIEVYRLEEPRSWRMRPIVSTLGGKWGLDGHEYELFFFFNEKGRLELIELEPVELECRDTLAAFSERFGNSEAEVSSIGPAKRTVARWQLGNDAVLTTLVLHFPNSEEWTCKSTIREPFPK